MFRPAAILLLSLLGLGLVCEPTLAADRPEAAPSPVAAGAFVAPVLQSAAAAQPVALPAAEPSRLRRPAALPALYAGLAAAQAFDAYSTRRGLAAGAREANPLMQGNGAAFWTMKAVGTVAPIVIAERMWKKNKAAAIVTMVVANGVMMAVAANNARVLAGQR